MTGGLLQLVTSGKQDIYLTINPEITFFKKVYRRHTNFSIELREITAEQSTDYNSLLTFIIDKQGDAIHRCYLEVELPTLLFSDKHITNSSYFNKKATDISNINNNKTKWEKLYQNLQGYVDIEIQLYRKLKLYLQTDNISLSTLKDEVTKFNYINKKVKDLYKNKIESKIYNMIDISGYVSSINKLITNEVTLNKSNFISVDEINNIFDKMYAIMLEYLDFYNYKINFYTKQKNEKTSEYQINFNYSKFLGHNYFEYFSLEIGGQEYEKYSNDFLHINQLHSIKPEYISNYLEMIGHTEELSTFNNMMKGGRKIIIPLIFWFNKDAGSCLPLVAMQYPTISINVKINDINKIICFENYEKMFFDMLDMTIGYEQTNTIILNTKLIYNNYMINIKEKSISYKCLLINNELMTNKFPDLLQSEIQIILKTNGSLYSLNEITQLIHPEYSLNYIQNLNGNNGINMTEYCIDMNQWIHFMINSKDSLYTSFIAKVASYYPYINFNVYYSMLDIPKVKLIGEYIFFDDVERAKFANSKLEYVIETYNEDIYNINNQQMFNCELSFNNPCKELMWYIQPQVFNDGLSRYSQNISLLFDSTKYFKNPIIAKQNLIFNQLPLSLNNIDDNYYTYLQSYKYLNNIIVDGIYYIPFCLYPEETQPSGTINLRQIKGKQYTLQISDLFLNEYFNDTSNYLNPQKKGLLLKFFAKCYDLFIVHKGNCKLMFNL